MNKFLKLSSLTVICAILTLSTACISTKREQEMQNKIVDMQARLLKMEGDMAAKEKDKEINQKIANQAMSFEKIHNEIARIKGEMDRLKVGVATGKIPGEPDTAESIALRLDAFELRLASLEQTASEKNDKNSKSDKNGDKDSKKKGDKDGMSVEALKKAFGAKQYKKVVEHAPATLKTLKGAEKADISFMHAESLYKLGDMRNSALAYDTFVNLAPKSEKMSFALMRLGDCFRNLGDKNTAAIYYKDLVDKFPQSQEAATAKERLSEELAPSKPKQD